MSTLVLDIETVGEDWEDLDTVTQENLLRWVRRSTSDKIDVERLERSVKDGLGLSPLTGMIIAIGLYDVERQQGIVYYQGEKDAPDFDEGEYECKVRSEKEMLEDFWEGARSYDTFVTFNGRRFDIPYLLLRSAILGVKPTKELMRGRYLSQQGTTKHIDLQDQLTFYGVMQKMPSLHLFARAFGIKSPKDDGIGGENIAELFHAKKFRDIATYNAKDITATTELYKEWKEYLGPQEFSEWNEERYLDD